MQNTTWEEIEIMSNQELLNRFSNISQCEGAANFRADMKKMREYGLEAEKYEHELLKRLNENHREEIIKKLI